MTVDTAEPAPPLNHSAPYPSLAERAHASDTTFILALFVTLTGKPCAKLVPVEAVDMLENDGVGFAGYAAGGMGAAAQGPRSDRDSRPVVVHPDPVRAPGTGDRALRSACQRRAVAVRAAHDPEESSAQAAELGLTVDVGAEVEYFLVTRTEDGALTTADHADLSAQPCYDARDVTRMYDHLTDISRAMNALGWGNYANDHEDGNGQFEQNFEYADALTTADRVITARYLLSVLAERRGMQATFMPKPFGNRTGSGMHMHLSLCDASGPHLPGPGRRQGPGTFGHRVRVHRRDPRPRLRAAGRHRADRQLLQTHRSRAPPAAAPPGRRSTASYGGNDRTHYLRVPDSQPGRTARRRRLGQPVPRRGGHDRRRSGRYVPRASIRAHPAVEPVRPCR